MNKSQEIIKGFLDRDLNLAGIERSLQIPQGSLKEIIEGREPEIGEAGMLSMLEQFPWFIQVADFNFFQTCVTSYKGCHPDIAASLKRGEHIRCRVDGDTAIIVAYINEEGSGCCYLDSYGNSWPSAKTIEKETFIIGPEEMMKEMIARGYKVDGEGWWVSKNSISMTPSAWQHCGKKEFPAFDWEPWMLEEREV